MKKIFFLTICFAAFAVQICFGKNEPLANQDKSGLYARSIEKVLRLQPDEVDLATAVLIVSEQWNDNVYGRRYLSKLDNMAIEIRSRLEDKGLAVNYKAIAVINEYLFEDEGFGSVAEANNPDDLFLHSVLDTKRGYCLSLSVLYLALGERLGLPLYGVVVPGHFFVRYDDERVRFNIETTGKGGYADDEHYIEKFNVPIEDRGTLYMKSLDKIQTLGCFFNNLGNSYSDIGNIKQAQIALERAAEINPSLAEARTNLGNIYLQKDRVRDAIRQYEMALKINPNDAKTNNNLGNAYNQQGKLNKAILQYKQSIALDPNFTDAYKNLATAYCKKNLFKLAVTAANDALAISPRDATSYNQLGDIYCESENYKLAISKYKKALKIKADSADAYYGLAVCYNRQELVEEEIAAYKKALEISPDMFAALANLGSAYFGKKDYDSAIEQYKKAILLRPDEGAIHYNLAAAYYNLKNYHMASEHIEIAQELGVKIDSELLADIENKL